jgi:lathosterol oxidase
MDLVLEGFDTFLFDPLYAYFLPAANAFGGLKGNATFSSTPAAPPSTWMYTPASEYLSFEPSQYAYMSQLARDDWRRQLFSLFIITWYAMRLTGPLPPFPKSQTSY